MKRKVPKDFSRAARKNSLGRGRCEGLVYYEINLTKFAKDIY